MSITIKKGIDNELKEFEEDAQWFLSNKTLYNKFKGQHVAVKNKKIVAYNKNLEKVVENLKKQGLEPRNTFVKYVEDNRYIYQ
jgi:Family of unknown function (DUF5678)